MLEIEIKYRLDAPETVRAFFTNSGVRFLETRQDADYYLNAPDRDFARTDEALRLRRIGRENFLTYKGPRYDTTTKTRREIELELKPGEEVAEGFLQLFQALGYRLVQVVKKLRHLYQFPYQGYEILFCWDEVQGLGNYLELEILAPQSEYEPAKKLLFDLAQKMGLTELENRSYLEMILGRAVVPGGER
ncbi:MAG: class IV adenylate cyclase [Gemmataceae bacterium]|jgi:adenylate cyclase class 2|nr:class IV adenylate cyclase [Gemmataceae bacterium]